VTPDMGVPGSPSTIRFRLVRSGDAGTPIFWTAYLMEAPTRGGTLSELSGGPVRSGEVVELVYVPAEATTAFVTIYPASTEAQQTGDGSGDWRSLAIEVRGGA
jgi:hypothetical protein